MVYKTNDTLIQNDAEMQFYKSLISRLNMPLLYMKVNYPGKNKDNLLTNSIMQLMEEIITDIFGMHVKMRLFRITEDGPNVTLVIDKDAVDIKKTSILIENNHVLGRCIDIDVYDNFTGQAVCRKDFGLEQRTCFICGDNASNCLEAQRHSDDQIIRLIHEKYKEFTEDFYVKKLKR
jgi:holo-ACP synthase